MFIKLLILKLVEAMMLESGVGSEIGSGDGEVVELEVVTEVHFGCGNSATKGANGVKCGGYVRVGGCVVGCVGRGVYKNTCFVIGGSDVKLSLILMVYLILVISLFVCGLNDDKPLVSFLDETMQ